MIPNPFLFVATFADGSQIFQTDADQSTQDAAKNCFYDVLTRGGPPVCFVITDGKKTFGVDLTDGHFEINGTPFFQHRPEHLPLKNFCLKYCRVMDQEQTFSARTGEAIGDPTGRVAGYSFGWETEHNGETIERILSIYLD